MPDSKTKRPRSPKGTRMKHVTIRMPTDVHNFYRGLASPSDGMRRALEHYMRLTLSNL